MNYKHLLYASAAFCAMLFASSCTDDKTGKPGEPTLDFTLTVNMPISVESPELTSVEATFTEVTTGQTITVTEFSAAQEESYRIDADLLPGQYNLTLKGVIRYTQDGVTGEGDIEASRTNIPVSEESHALTVETTVATIRTNNFVIEEIFFTGSLTPEGQQYYGDQYMKITNNSDQTLYADGLIIFKSAFMTVDKYDYTPDIMATHFSVDSGLILPGSGTDYPVAPGASIVIADTAIDHREFNSQSLDLSGATFEYYNTRDDEDVDNPNVPNVQTLFADDSWTWHNRGFYSYAIGRLGEGVTAESFAKDYAYTAHYEMVVEGYGSFPMEAECWKVPNAWVIDAVNLSIESMFMWIVTSPTLDSGWTYCGKIDKDQTRYGKSVRRKVYKQEEGRTIYKDTNNSTVDFTAESPLSLL
ncbi:MAG TPA: DUF4876 domain-containing protein [Candidatus Alistipes avicola]|uniref:DUF4876 domain-containing protein n=1 Tax=Candidatus Alistipes avicola TaxID=2838432 RepID=A0A9D2L385_9BACT|nr:DUF4876 domain-containing protein [uncultured Alistipes sp.]HJA98288.1 DUF4876 domain-containing protein [Candidatus Alistipes avicola]